MRAEADVHTETESEVPVGFSRDVETKRLVEDVLVSIGRNV
jgi:hypothetical protein